MDSLANALGARTQMENYWIERPLMVSKSAIVYLAEDMRRNQKVFLTEFFPQPMAQRRYSEDGSYSIAAVEGHEDEFNEKMAWFLAEAEAFSSVEHPDIIKIIRFFQANGTAYAAAAYQEGNCLPGYLATHGGALGEAEVKTLMMPLLKALTALVHRNIAFGNIAKANIYRNKDASAALMACVNTLSSSRSSEQGAIGNELYALGAIIYQLVSGTRPPDETRRAYAVSKGESDPYLPLNAPEDASQTLCDALNACLSLDASKRPKSIIEFQAMFGEDKAPRPSAPAAAEKPQAPLSGIRLLSRTFYYASLSVIAGSLLYLFLYRSSEVQLAQVNEFDIARYHLAANLGNVEAQRALGHIYSRFAGENHNDEKAFYWYRQAAADGDGEAQLALGLLYQKGIGVAQSREMAAEWFEKAAAQGIEEAAVLLAAIKGESNATQ